MDFKYVKIGEGGKVDVKTSELYSKEETALANECIGIINADLKLKKLFADAAVEILKDYVVGTVEAYKTRDTVARLKVMQTAVDLLKGLTVHMHVQVMLKKKKEAKP